MEDVAAEAAVRRIGATDNALAVGLGTATRDTPTVEIFAPSEEKLAMMAEASSGETVVVSDDSVIVGAAVMVTVTVAGASGV